MINPFAVMISWEPPYFPLSAFVCAHAPSETWHLVLQSGTRHDSDPQSLHECEKLEELMKSAAGNLNPYGLDWPVCNDVVKRHGRNQRHLLLKLLGEARGQKHDPDEAFKPCEEVNVVAQACF